MAVAALTLPLAFDDAWHDFSISLRAKNVSPHTVDAYQAAAFQLRDFLADRDRSTAPADISRGDVQAFIAGLLSTRSAATANTRYWGLRALFGWLAEEGEIAESPLHNVKPPAVEDRPPNVLTDDEVRKLLAACGPASGGTFPQRRDLAIVRLLYDGGLRVGELAGMTVGELSVDRGMARVMGKGRRERDVFFGPATALAINRYLRVRISHLHAKSPRLWLGTKGPLTESGVGQMLKDRAVQAGLNPALNSRPSLPPYLRGPVEGCGRLGGRADDGRGLAITDHHAPLRSVTSGRTWRRRASPLGARRPTLAPFVRSTPSRPQTQRCGRQR
ncbi:MAG: integrase [Chloroflexi bacterium]|nr:MAG: integrase [Chloroflexota bacterium]